VGSGSEGSTNPRSKESRGCSQTRACSRAACTGLEACLAGTQGNSKNLYWFQSSCQHQMHKSKYQRLALQQRLWKQRNPNKPGFSESTRHIQGVYEKDSRVREKNRFAAWVGDEIENQMHKTKHQIDRATRKF
jgi:hypothetical protein